MRLLICAGGTGGGVYPALAVHKALGDEAGSVLWVGSEGKMEADLVQRENVPFTSIPAAGVHGVGLRALPGNLLRLMRGTLAAGRIIKQFRPDVLLFTGGYVAVPVAVAGRGIPTLLYVPDIEPGLALKVLARFADRIALTTPESRRFFSRPDRTSVTGYPTRPNLQPLQAAEARQQFGLRPDLPVIGVFGGSSGARSINQAILSILPALLPETQVLHITGRLDWEEVQAAKALLPLSLSARYAIFPYLHEEMAAALSSADLAISRAGASTLGELPLFGLPAILVPYPFAWRYQRVNAEYLASRQAALVLEDADMQVRLLPMIKELLQSPQKLQEMRASMQALATPQAAERIASLVKELAAGHQPERQATW